jgi:hypothetical protein
VSAGEWLTLPTKAYGEKNALSQRPRKSEKPTDEEVLDNDASVCLSHWILRRAALAYGSCGDAGYLKLCGENTQPDEKFGTERSKQNSGWTVS